MKIMMLTGSVPPEICGVGDYTMSLSSSLRAIGCEVFVEKLNLFSFFQVFKNRKNNIIHLQYPSIGYGTSLLPQLVAALTSPVVTIHEFSQVHILRRLAELPLMLCAKKIIVTTEHEKNAIINLWYRFGRKITVIPVAPAFMPDKNLRDSSVRNGIVFFGLMRKGKGLEEFIELSRKLRHHFPLLPISIYSAVPKGSAAYFEEVKLMSDDLDINWFLNKTLNEVSAGLVCAKYSYLFFPDGVSERRSSFMAVLGHGVLVLSNSSKMTSSNLQETFVDVQSPQDALSAIVSLEHDLNKYSSLQTKGLKAFEFYSPINVANMHLQIYKEAWEQK